MLKTRFITGLYCISILACIFLLMCYPVISSAAGPIRSKMTSTASEKINLTAGKSLTIESREVLKRVAVAQPAIVEATILSPRQIYLNAKAPGTTSLTLWGPGDTIAGILDIEVTPDVNGLKETIHRMFPGEKGILVTSSGNYLTLSGSVSSAAVAAQVVEIARPYVPGDKEGKSRLINIMEVGGVHQVMLEIKVSEMSRTLGRELGINFAAIGRGGREGNIAFLSNFPSQATTSVGSVIAQYIRGDVTWNLLLDALKEEGLIKILAEPTLITLSGKEARFLAGGEFPVPVPQSSSFGNTANITIEYKPFGVGLVFTPVVLSNRKISMQVAPEVSELDFTTTVTLQNYVIPSINTRRVATTVELADGQSFAIAGLLKEEARETISKFPVLGDIPILGALFRSSSFQRRDTELVVIVTPHLVKPVDLNKQTLPTDSWVEPNDFEFYLLGTMDGQGGSKRPGNVVQPPQPSRGKLEGEFGHATPGQ